MLLCVLMSWPLVYFIFNSVIFLQRENTKAKVFYWGLFVFFFVGFQLTSFKKKAVCSSDSFSFLLLKPRALSVIALDEGENQV